MELKTKLKQITLSLRNYLDSGLAQGVLLFLLLYFLVFKVPGLSTWLRLGLAGYLLNFLWNFKTRPGYWGDLKETAQTPKGYFNLIKNFNYSLLLGPFAIFCKGIFQQVARWLD